MDFYIFSRFFCLNLVLFQQSGMIYFPSYRNSQIQPKTDSSYGLLLLVWNDRERNCYLMYVFTITNSAKNISEEAVHHWSLQTKLKYIANYNCLVYYVVDNNTTKQI
jgi:hypothetical protein